MRTYGIYGSHTTEGCPLFNRENRQLLLSMVENFENKAHRYNVKIKEQYHSDTFVWTAEADNAHSIEDLMIETGVAKFNTLKIVPLRTLGHVVESCKKLESQTP